MTGYKASGESYAPKWRSQLDPLNGHYAIGFLDLLEIKFIGFFLRNGVKMNTLSKVREVLTQDLNTPYPFCTGRFVTDGRDILDRAGREVGATQLVNVLSRQHEMPEIVDEFIRSLDFEDGNLASRWWPKGKELPVIIDPKFNFGHPTLYPFGIDTRTISKAYFANGQSENDVSSWFEIPPQSVLVAVEFESALAA